MRDYRNVRACGPWAYVEILDKDEEAYSLSQSGLYVPGGTFEQRKGLSRARILSLGSGVEVRGKVVPPEKMGLFPGKVVLYRGFLEEVNKPHPLVDDYAFIHMTSFLFEEVGDARFS